MKRMPVNDIFPLTEQTYSTFARDQFIRIGWHEKVSVEGVPCYRYTISTMTGIDDFNNAPDIKFLQKTAKDFEGEFECYYNNNGLESVALLIPKHKQDEFLEAVRKQPITVKRGQTIAVKAKPSATPTVYNI